MAGHSKWANIQHRKKAQDAKRGKLFTRLIREVTIAARMGGDDMTANPRLRAAVDGAKAANMSNDTIDRAIKRGAGNQEGDNVEEITYEGYASHGVAVLVECITDNRNRTVAEVRHAFSKRGGNLGTEGSVAYLFSKVGQFIFAPGVDDDAVMEVALDIGCDDVETMQDGCVVASCAPVDFHTVKTAFEAASLPIADASITMIASTEVDLAGDDAKSVLALLDMLEDLDDVQNVYSNANLSEDVYSD